MSSTSPINQPMSLLAWTTLILLSILWGGSFFFFAVLVRELPTLTIVVGRVALAALFLLLAMRLMGLRMPTDRKIWSAFFCMGFLNNAVPFCLIVWGQTTLASGVASILNATTPLFAVVVAHFLTSDEKMTSTRIAGVGFGFVGVIVLIGGDLLQGLSADLLASMAILGAALTYSFAGVYGRRFKALGVSPMATAAGQVTASSIQLFPVMMIVDQPWLLPAPSLGAMGALAGVAILSTAFAYVLYFRLLETSGATNLMLVTFLVPVTAILLGVLFLGEVLLLKHLIGMALIALGLAAIDGRLWQRYVCSDRRGSG